jgi:flavin-dependent dehydrogenase
MLSDEIAEKHVDIKNVFYEFIDNSPELKLKFKDAIQQSKLQGFGLPLGSKTGIISGNSFILTGDAASLIDPISGDGIGNAMLSGMLAAEQTMKCFKQNNYTDSFMKQYDNELMKILGPELKTHYKAQRILFKMPFLLDLVFLASRNPVLRRIIRKRL